MKNVYLRLKLCFTFVQLGYPFSCVASNPSHLMTWGNKNKTIFKEQIIFSWLKYIYKNNNVINIVIHPHIKRKFTLLIKKNESKPISFSDTLIRITKQKCLTKRNLRNKPTVIKDYIKVIFYFQHTIVSEMPVLKWPCTDTLLAKRQTLQNKYSGNIG